MNIPLPSVDELIELAKRDPEGLENLRKQQIEQLITAAPEKLQNRLRGLQFQIDSRRRLHKSPMGACLMISDMMLDSLGRLNEALHGSITHTPPKEARAASVLKFPAAANQ